MNTDWSNCNFLDCHALILAAGFSSRMGSFKPLMQLGGYPLLQHLVLLYRKVGLVKISVVCGHKAEAVKAEAEKLGINWILNPSPEQGMFSSVKAGLIALAGLASPVTGLFVHPVDIPLVRPDTVRLLMQAAEHSDRQVLIPTYAGEIGHPPLIDPELIPSILEYNGAGGLRAVLQLFAPELVPVADHNILFDLDEPDDYLLACHRLEKGEEL
jgi:CTP:molybdopterin cytidylyltransferase MocA